MGIVAAARLVDASGVVHDWDPGVAAPDGQVEYLFEYAPRLLPEPAHLVGGTGMWRYADLLPLDPGPIRFPLTVGGTPLLASPGLREVSGLDGLWLKDETRGPTGSNKDRATALVLETALRRGVRTVSCASTGNVASSLAVGAAACGLEAVVFVPSQVSDAKLALMLAAGATVVKVEEGYEAAFRLSREAVVSFGWLDRNTGVNPATIDAKKTAALEIWEQLGRRAPDAVLVPVGDGPTLCGMAKGFEELMACGACDRMPRMVGVQAEGCQPLKRAWQTGGSPAAVWPDTIADGIAVGAPVSAGAALRYVRRSGGGFVSVTDAAMLEAVKVMAGGGGMIAEPAGAAAFAGIGPALEAGLIVPSDTVVVHVTGTGLKTPQYLVPQGRAVEVRADLGEVERALARRATPA